jgi:hypothetical protein
MSPILSVIHAECHYAVCRYAECHGAQYYSANLIVSVAGDRGFNFINNVQYLTSMVLLKSEIKVDF